MGLHPTPQKLYLKRVIIMPANLQKANFEKRFGAFLIDHIILSTVMVFGFLLTTWRHLVDSPERVMQMFPIFLIIVFICYCLKDVVGGASIGKRTVGIAVRDSEDAEQKPPASKLFLRNVFSFLWVIELFMILCSKNKRKIGDNLVNTDVYVVSPQIKPAGIVVTVVMIVVVFVSSTFFGATSLLRNSESFRVATSYIEASEEIRDIVGEITGFGFFPQGNISITNNHDTANFIIRVRGEYDDLRVAIWLERMFGRNWEIVGVSY